MQKKKKIRGIRYTGIWGKPLYPYTPVPFKLIAILVFVVAFPALAKSQQTVKIIYAEKIVGTVINGQSVQKLLGDVHLRTKDMEMFADRAIKYPETDLVKAFGNIQINTVKEIIWADTLIYYTDLDFAKLRSRVIIKSDSTTLFSNAVDYRFTSNVAHFLERILLVDSTGVLAADKGFYFRRADSAAFRGHVQLKDSLNYAEGKFLFSNREREYYELHENVFAFDKKNNTKLSGNYLESDSTGRNVVIGDAWLINFESDTTNSIASSDSLNPIGTDSVKVTRPDSAQIIQPDSTRFFQTDTLAIRPDTARTQPTSQPDTTHIKARRIVSTQHRIANDTTTIIRAYENVRIWSPDFSAVSDSARFESETEIFELWGSAKIWYNQIQLSSPYIWVKLYDGDIKELIAYPDPFVVRQDTTISRLNQIKGDTLKAYFVNGSMKRMEVYPNSHMLRFTKKSGKPDGAIELTSPKTVIYFENGKLTELKSLADGALVNGYYRPEDVLAKNKQLTGFTWNPDLRPQKPEQPMQRRLPPISDEPPFELPKRYLEYIQQEGGNGSDSSF